MEVCGTSSGLDVPTGDRGHSGVTGQSGGPNTGVPLRENIYKTTCICKKDYLTSFLYLCSCLLVYLKACLWTKVPLSLWSIPSQNMLNSLTVSQICMDLSLTGYPQGPHRPDWMITVLSASMCMGSLSVFLPFARREKHKHQLLRKLLQKKKLC